MDIKNTQLMCTFDKDTYQTLNSQFAKVRIRIAYDGLNRNNSIIPKEVLDKMSKTSLLNIPIVGEWSEEKQNFLGHGGKLEADDEGIRFIDTTRPYGVIPSDSEIYWETIKDKQGFEDKTYLCCTGILWYGRYPETEKILEDGSNQSMEISLIKSSYTPENKLLIEDAEFSALCILGKDDFHPKGHRDSTEVEPCFEDSTIDRYSYSSGQFKKEFTLMMEEYKRFNLVEQEPTNLDINNNPKKEEKILAENLAEKKQFNVQLDQEKINSKLATIIAGNQFRNKINKHYNKYEILSIDSSTINVIDREDGYKIYTIPYMATEVENEAIVTIDADNKVEKSFVIGEKLSEDLFNIEKEVEIVSMDTSNYNVANHQSDIIDNLNRDLDDMTENFNNATGEIKRLTKQLEAFESEKKEFEVNKHKERVNDLLANYERVVPKCVELSQYSLNVDYKKSYETIEGEVIKIYADYKFKTESNGKKSYQAIQTEIIDTPYVSSKSSNNRYGNYFED